MTKFIHQVLLIVLLVLSSTIAALQLTSNSTDSERRLVEGDAKGADLQKALRALDSEERARLTARETAAFVAEPLNTAALQNIAILRELDGQKADAEAIALALASYSRRKSSTQLPAVQISLLRGDFKQAYSRLDGVLRAQPQLGEQLFPSMMQSLTKVAAQKELAGVLAKEPPWRNAFITKTLEIDKSGALMFRLLKDIRSVGGAVFDYEKQQLLSHYVAAKRSDQAYFVWLDMLSKDELVLVRNIYDGGFSREPKNLYFDWTISSRATAAISTAVRAGQSTDKVLKLDFFADKVGGAYAYQYLRLSPGKYTVSFDVQVDQMKNETGLVWRVNCIEEPIAAGESDAVLSRSSWEKRQFSIDVPVKGCATQLFYLANKSSVRLDQEISGRLSFDNITISEGALEKKKDVIE